MLFSLLSFFFCSSSIKVQEHGETEPEHDALQAVWLSTLATHPSCIVPLLAYIG